MTTACASDFKPHDLPNWIKNQPKGINFVTLAPSPSGDVIAFEYTDNDLGRNYLGVGLFNRRTGQLIRVPNPPKKQLSQPSFSHDGKRLAVGIGSVDGIFSSQIGVVDLATMSVVPVTPDGGLQTFPVFQPETGNILYTKSPRYFNRGFYLLNMQTKKEQVILASEVGFYFILPPSFIGKDEILFQASAPYEAELRKITMEFSAMPLSYRLRFGGSPQLFSLEAERQSMKIVGNEGAFGDVSASRAAGVIAYESTTPYSGNKITRELFALRNGHPVQLTNKHSTVTTSRISYDGTVIAFVADIAEPYKFDLCIYDVASGSVVSASLLDRIKNDPAFALK